MVRKKKQTQVSRLMERIGLVEPRQWPIFCRWWFRDKPMGIMPSDPYSRLYYLTIGYHPEPRDLYEIDILDRSHYNLHFGDGISPVFRGEVEPPMPRAIDLQRDVELSNDRLPVLIERIRAVIYDEKQTEIVGTAQELSERFGYIEPAQFGRDIGVIEDNLMEFGIDVDKTRTPKKRLIKIWENLESPYHPLQQDPPELDTDEAT